MEIGLIVVATLTLGGIAALLWTRRRAIGSREALSMEELYRQSDLGSLLSFADFSETMGLVARCYGLKPGKLRRTDSFRGNLAVAGSTLVDNSEEILWKSLCQRYPFLEGQPRFDTIGDLLRAVGVRDGLSDENQRTS